MYLIIQWWFDPQESLLGSTNFMNVNEPKTAESCCTATNVEMLT